MFSPYKKWKTVLYLHCMFRYIYFVTHHVYVPFISVHINVLWSQNMSILTTEKNSILLEILFDLASLLCTKSLSCVFMFYLLCSLPNCSFCLLYLSRNILAETEWLTGVRRPSNARWAEVLLARSHQLHTVETPPTK